MTEDTTRTNRLTTRSGIGGAHLGWSMFGARGPLLIEEGSGGASGTPAAGAPADPPPSSPAAPANDKTFTQAQVNELVGRARDEGRQSALKKPTIQPTPPEGDDKLTLKALQQRLDESEARRQFDRRASKLGLADEVADDLYDLYRTQKPENVDDWFAKKSKVFGAKESVQQPSNPQQPANPETKQPPAAAPSAPVKVDQLPTQNGAIDIYTMTPEQFRTMSPDKIREHHEHNLKLAAAASGAPPPPRMTLGKR